MILHSEISDRALRSQIRQRAILWGGNRQLNIYGTLKCASGKRLKRKNRVFFATEAEAIQRGFRPCGHCLRAAYQAWKRG